MEHSSDQLKTTLHAELIELDCLYRNAITTDWRLKVQKVKPEVQKLIGEIAELVNSYNQKFANNEEWQGKEIVMMLRVFTLKIIRGGNLIAECYIDRGGAVENLEKAKAVLMSIASK